MLNRSIKTNWARIGTEIEISGQRHKLSNACDYRSQDVGISLADLEPEADRPYWDNEPGTSNSRAECRDSVKSNPHLSGARRGMLLLSLYAMLLGTVGIATQAIYQQSELNAVTVGFYRLAFAFPVVALLCWKMVGKEVFRVKGQHYVKMTLIGVMLALYQVFYFAAIGYLGVAVAALIALCSAPIVIALASMVFLKEPITRPTFIALVCALLGAGLLVGLSDAAIEQNNLYVGVSLAVGSGIGYAIVAMVGKSIAKDCHPIHSTTVAFGVGAVFLFPMAAANVFSVHYTPEIWSLLLYAGLIPTAVAYTLFFIGMRNVKPSTASILTLLEPLTAAILAWFIFGERLATSGLVGIALLLISMVILYRGEKQPTG
jgi:DME family drug/metabolite transporter